MVTRAVVRIGDTPRNKDPGRMAEAPMAQHTDGRPVRVKGDLVKWRGLPGHGSIVPPRADGVSPFRICQEPAGKRNTPVRSPVT
jgi:hypothetical protein